MTGGPAVGSVRSRSRWAQRRPRVSISAAVSRAPASSSRCVKPTSNPSAARATAVARPIPEFAPVTIAVSAIEVFYPVTL